MDETLVIQKQFFNIKQTIAQTKKEWPFILKRKFFIKFTNFIMKCNINSFAEKYALMMPLVQVFLSAIKYSAIDSKMSMCIETKILEKLFLFFSEDSSEVYAYYPVSKNINN